MSSLRERAAGVICVGFDGQTLETELRAQLRKTPFAGIILFGRNVKNVEQTRALTDLLRECFDRTAPIIAIDQEGGRVARIREGVVTIPSMMTLAATGNPDLALQAGEQIAHDLRRAGVNLDFAPVCDLATHGENIVIGARAFSDDPQTVTVFARALAAGLERGGIIPTFKHFPGHGSTATDSHLALPRVELDERALRTRDLIPFAALLPGARAVMTAHIVMTAFDAENPATHARRILTDLLRGELGFSGVCFTDCMEMDAIAKSVGTAQGALLALQAGADCVLISHRLDLALDAVERIVAAVEDGTLPRQRLDEAFARVQTLRAGLQSPVALDDPAPHPHIGDEIATAAVTLVRGEVPLQPARAVIISFEGVTTEGAQGTHAPARAASGPDSQVYALPLEPQPAEVDAVLEKIANQKNRTIVHARRAHVYETQAAAIDKILAAFPGALIVSMREPADIGRFASARNVLAVYGDEDPNVAALHRATFERGPQPGTLPVRWRAAR
ncbi:MAG: beta-N-acetylhexosaminidase [Candidatus Eremiobacteraeota bacterium]|nr:beta-N-acetylhexosaminidase [Candidatus Eremiobacteraeota bacterium]